MPEPLKTRFARFLTALPEAEAIDALDLPDDPANPRKADFLLASRRVVVEVKSLEGDPASTIAAEIDKHRVRPDFPQIYGKTNTQTVLAALPDGDKIYRRFFFAMTRSVEAAIRDAEEQVTNTQEVLNLPDSVRMLVILNESIEVFDPTVVGYRVGNLMRRPRTGKSAAKTLDFVWLNFESHTVGKADEIPVLPHMLIRGERASEFSWFPGFYSGLLGRLAAFNGAAFLGCGTADPYLLAFEKNVPRPNAPRTASSAQQGSPNE